MPEEKVEFKWLEAKLTGTDTVVFRLEDGAIIKIRVDINRAGVAIDFKNPDGTPHYSIGAALNIQIVPSSKKFYIPKSKLKIPRIPKEPKMKPI